MGLPLYIAPVESDIHGKPATTKGPVRNRSAIRRLRHRNSEAMRDQREARRRAAMAAAAASAAHQNAPENYRLGSRSVSHEARTVPATSNPAPGSNSATAGGSTRAQEALREFMGTRMGGLDDHVVAMFGERWASLHARSGPSPTRDEDTDDDMAEGGTYRLGRDSSSYRLGRDSLTLPPIRRAVVQGDTEPSTRRMPRSPPPLHRVPSGDLGLGSQVARRDVVARVGGAIGGSDGNGSDRTRDPLFSHSPHENYWISPWRNRPPQSARFDGLGDRDRSLSPEGDGVWDTLLTTLTPDPQPPSVGSSFASATASATATASASASASAAASQSAAAGSSDTSLTGPETAEESVLEHPCFDSSSSSDSEGEEDLLFTSHLRPVHHRQSYADVAAHGLSQNSASSSNNTSDEALDLLGMGGMQNIVRNLARREDIPDEWWAEAGLSRTLPREA